MPATPLLPYGIPFPTTPLPTLCEIFVAAATGLRVLRVLTGPIIDLAPFGSDLREICCEEAFGSSLAIAALGPFFVAFTPEVYLPFLRCFRTQPREPELSLPGR